MFEPLRKMCISTFHNTSASRWKNIIGSYLLLLQAQPLFFLGNMAAYVPSYILVETGKLSGKSESESQDSWFVPVFTTAWMLGLFLSGIVTRFLKAPWIISSGCLLQAFAFFISAYTINISMTLFYSTLCVSLGIGIGLYEGLVLKHYVVDETRSNNNTMTSIVLSSSSVGGVIINEFITLYINPQNKSPDSEVGNMKVFTQEEILGKIPSMFQILGGGSLAVSVLGLMLLNEKRAVEEQAPLILSDNEIKSADPNHQRQNGEDSSIDEGKRMDTHFSENDSEEIITKTRGKSENSKVVVDISHSNSRDELIISSLSLNLSPFQLFKTGFFYKASLVYLLGSSSKLLISVYYKLYGELYIEDDYFLTFLGTAMSFLAAVSSIVLGVLIAKAELKTCFVITYSGASVSFFGMYFLARVDKWAYFNATLFVSLFANFIYTLFTVAIAHWFGKDHFESNLALFEIPSSLGYFLATCVTDSLLSQFGYFAAFLWTACAQIVGLILIVLWFPVD